MPSVDPKGFLTAVLHSGVGRYVCQLQRLTFKFCKEMGSSRGVRDFIENDLMDFAKKNPGVVVYLLPVKGQMPVLFAEYLNGREEHMETTGWHREYIIKFVEHLRARSGNEIVNFRKYIRTEHPSIQGPWTPFTHQPTEWNLLKLPDAEGLQPVKFQKTATEIVLEMARAQGIKNIVTEAKNLPLTNTSTRNQAIPATDVSTVTAGPEPPR